ncbi:DegT/DnrJ/EryC1/StrS family aminotransferase [Pedobacter flavus]|uniref:DegT/DnrJ/EryC1/StrS family aminotransferase n=1 Tax=Pedobacter flavus TaxID=3113906 RepID=A0ABU7GY42_9SPHI|nr:DegT/DnrJ/EryC1/StrS family aminotransferase [Pedobacter sp. VNH31]MEE1883916.1 DegT/DnrJ/EryC1/StrS family aminotransferase [Pedobacter sp. VNH31]
MMNTKPIPVNTPLLSGNELKYLSECIETGWISSEGPFITKFEENFSKYIGRNFGVAVSNGSAALDIAVKALEIGEDDEIIMPTFTIISPAQSVITNGAIPVLVDSDPNTWNMDVSQIESKITSKTKAILVVHIYGLPADLDPILELAKRYNLKVIEDAAEMHGQTYNGKKCGSFGDISIFSFYPNKHITTGEGGMILTDDAHLVERCKKLRNLCFEPNGPRFIHHELGWNYRMTNLQAALGLAQLERINEFIDKKRELGAFYQQKLSFLAEKGYSLPLSSTDYSDNIYWVFGLVAPNIEAKEEIIKYLSDQKVGTRPFFWCMHEQPVFQKMGLFKNEKYPIAENLARNGFYLPSGLGLSMEDRELVVEILKNHY